MFIFYEYIPYTYIWCTYVPIFILLFSENHKWRIFVLLSANEQSRTRCIPQLFHYTHTKTDSRILISILLLETFRLFFNHSMCVQLKFHGRLHFAFNSNAVYKWLPLLFAIIFSLSLAPRHPILYSENTLSPRQRLSFGSSFGIRNMPLRSQPDSERCNQSQSQPLPSFTPSLLHTHTTYWIKSNPVLICHGNTFAVLSEWIRRPSKISTEFL